MAGYFDYLGRVLSEKGSWYKILMIVALQGMAILFSPQDMIRQLTQGSIPEFNIPGIILYLLASTLVFGFVIQIYHSFMNDKQNLLPDVDFLDMLAKSVRLVPFSLVYGIYLFLLPVGLAIILPAIMLPMSLNYFIIIVFALISIVLVIGCPVLMIIHSKSFSYKYVLNPLTAFRVLPRVIWPMLLLILLYGLLAIVLYALFIGGAIMLGVSGEETSTSTMVAFGGLAVVFGYLNNAFSFAYNLKLADIVKTRLADTDYLDSDYDYGTNGSEEDESDSDDSLDY